MPTNAGKNNIAEVTAFKCVELWAQTDDTTNYKKCARATSSAKRLYKTYDAASDPDTFADFTIQQRTYSITAGWVLNTDTNTAVSFVPQTVDFNAFNEPLPDSSGATSSLVVSVGTAIAALATMLAF